MIIAILLTITPFIFPIFLTALGLLTGMVQAYIFSILAAVYIAAATQNDRPKPVPAPQSLKQPRSNQGMFHGHHQPDRDRLNCYCRLNHCRGKCWTRSRRRACGCHRTEFAGAA